MLIGHWGQDDTLFDIAPGPFGDNMIDEKDFENLMSYWGQEVEEPTLINHWALDETEGTIAYDSAGENDADVFGGALWQPTNGQVDGALLFDGIDDHIRTPFVLNPAETPFRIYVWIKGGAAGQTIISQANGVNWLSADASEGRLMSELVSGRGATPLVSDVVITDGDWHRIGLTWDMSRKVLYVDDVEVASDTLAGVGTSQDDLYIGTGRRLEPGTFCSGLIDDIRICDQQWTIPR